MGIPPNLSKSWMIMVSIETENVTNLNPPETKKFPYDGDFIAYFSNEHGDLTNNILSRVAPTQYR